MIIVISKIDNGDSYKQFMNMPNVLVYNKSFSRIQKMKSIKVDKKCGHIHSLYHYIYNNYDNLDDHIIFISLYTEMHGTHNELFSQSFIDKIWYYINNASVLDIQFECISNYKSVIKKNIWITEDDPDMQHINVTTLQNTIDLLFIKLFGSSEMYDYEYGEGVNYILSKKVIHSRPKSDYLYILHFLENIDIDQLYEKIVIESITEKIFTGKFTEFVSYEPSTIESDYIEPIVEVIEPSTIESDCIEPIVEVIEPSNTQSRCIEPIVEDIDPTNIFDTPLICFRPIPGYCDHCNVMDIKKPINHNLKAFCSEKCKQEYYND
jgi:hypothetical protein